MDLPGNLWSNKGFLASKPIGRGSAREKKSCRNDRLLGCPKNTMRCSEMVEVVE